MPITVYGPGYRENRTQPLLEECISEERDPSGLTDSRQSRTVLTDASIWVQVKDTSVILFLVDW